MKLLAIDGNSIMNRAFYGIKLLSNSKGQFTNALTGFMNIYLKEIGEVKPDCVAVAFDLKAPTFRHKANAAYKANRKGMPEELAQQMPVIKELLGDLGIKIVQCEGYEADDILGTLSKAAADSGNECYILTGDRDSFQLVSDRVTVRLATTKETKIYTPDRIMEEYGVTPRQMIEVKALMGDTSDNISGVKGIGEKTALSLIKQEGDVKTLYEHLADIKLTPSVRTKLENGHQDAIDSRFLAEICLEAPVDKATEFYKLGEVDTEKTKALLADLEMMRLIDRLGLSGKLWKVLTAQCRKASSSFPTCLSLRSSHLMRALYLFSARTKQCILSLPTINFLSSVTMLSTPPRTMQLSQLSWEQPAKK